MKIRALFQVIDFFLPTDVLLAVFMVFALENIVAQIVGDVGVVVWLALYVVGTAILGLTRYLSADEEEMEDLQEDFDDL